MDLVSSDQLNPSNASDPGYGQLFAVLLRRWPWILGSLSLCLIVAYTQTLRQKPVYKSSMQLLVESNYQPKQGSSSNTKDAFTDANVEVDTGTQLTLMQSPDILRRAMKVVQPQYPELDPNNPGSVQGVQNSLSVTQVTTNAGSQKVSTKIFQIEYTGDSSEKTQKVLQALQSVYQEYNLEQQRLRLTKGLNFITRQLPEAEKQLREAEADLEQFRTTQGMVNPEEQAKAQEARLNQLLQEQQTTLAEIKSLQSRFDSLKNQVAMSPETAIAAARLSQSTRYQALLGELQKTELALVQERLRFKDKTPYVQKLLDQRQQQLNLLQIESQRVVGGTEVLDAEGNSAQFSRGQMGELDLTLIGELVTAYNTLQASIVRYNSLVVAVQQGRRDLTRFPKLLANFSRLQPEIELKRDTLKQLLTAQQQLGLEIARGGFDWQIIVTPQLGQQMDSGARAKLLLGAVVGLFLGGIAAFAREGLDGSVHSANDLKKQNTIPILAAVPEFVLEPGKRFLPLALPSLGSTLPTPSFSQIIHWAPFRESIDVLYQNIQLLSVDSPLRSLVITSTQLAEGKSTLTMALATSAARLHRRVLLIDADLRRPSLHKLLNLPNDQGLSTLLTSDEPLPRQLNGQASNVRANISVLTAGPIPADPAKLLSSQRMREVIAAFEANYDLVLLDVPPVLGIVDAIIAASHTDGIVMVGRMGLVKQADFLQAIAALEKNNVVGVVANGIAYQSRKNAAYQPQAAN